MTDETSKTKRLWGALENSVLQGDGLDIGCGPDPVFPHVTPFDLAQGDANNIELHISKQFDFVYSSHCLEHMADPVSAISGWWRLVKPGGVLFLIVPDEDLYEQGFWPSRFNPDHKWTFTISKHKSWSPVSISLLDLVRDLPNSELLDIRLQDDGYERWLLSNGSRPGSFLYSAKRRFSKLVYPILRILGFDRTELKKHLFHPIDQTTYKDTLAQIQCIVRKRADD